MKTLAASVFVVVVVVVVVFDVVVAAVVVVLYSCKIKFCHVRLKLWKLQA